MSVEGQTVSTDYPGKELVVVVNGALQRSTHLIVAVVLVLVLVLVYMNYKASAEPAPSTERMFDLTEAPVSGNAATVRHMPNGWSQYTGQFSGSNQSEISPFTANAAVSGEGLVNGRGDPQFWSSTQELAQYRAGVTDPGDLGASERFLGEETEALKGAPAGKHWLNSGFIERASGSKFRKEALADSLTAALKGGSAYNYQ